MRGGILTAAAVAAGLVIGVLDSSAGWDSTGITAGLLLLAAGTVAATSGDRPWLWALLVGLPIPLLEIPTGGSRGSLAAIGFAAVGATIGWTIHRARRGSGEDTLRD